MTSAREFRSEDRPVLLWVTRSKTVPAGRSEPTAVAGRFEPSVREWKVSPDYLNRADGRSPTHWGIAGTTQPAACWIKRRQNVGRDKWQATVPSRFPKTIMSSAGGLAPSRSIIDADVDWQPSARWTGTDLRRILAGVLATCVVGPNPKQRM